jgi:hypothetical protein
MDKIFCYTAMIEERKREQEKLKLLAQIMAGGR